MTRAHAGAGKNIKSVMGRICNDFDFAYNYGGHNADNAYKYGGHPAPIGASPTQPYKCSQNVKIKVNVNVFIQALANVV